MSLLGDKFTINYTSGMKNETKKEATLQKSKQTVQAQREQNSQQESSTLCNARWLSLINYADAWEKIDQPGGHYFPKIDPREFEGTAPRFTWE